MVELGKEVGDFECKVADESTVMFVSEENGYNFVLVTQHGNKYKVQWGAEDRDDMIYVCPGDEVIDEEEILYKENPRELVTETDTHVTFNSKNQAVEAAIQFIESF